MAKTPGNFPSHLASFPAINEVNGLREVKLRWMPKSRFSCPDNQLIWLSNCGPLARIPVAVTVPAATALSMPRLTQG